MNDKLELDIPVLLPDLPDAADACLDRLVSTLSKREGVERAHVICLDGDTPAALCIHFDAAKLPLPRLREMVRAAGAEITERYGHAIWQVTGISHERRARTVSDALCALPGVVQASASTSGSVRVEYDRRETTEEEVRAALRKLKVRVGKRVAADDHAGHDHGPGGHDAGEEKHGPGDGHDHSHAEFLGPNTELIFALACGALLGIGYAIERLVAGAPEWLPTACYVAAYFFGGFFTLREAIDNLRMKKFEIDTLMLVAAAGAAALGAWAEGALLLFLFSLGHALEHYAMGRAKKAIEALAKLAPETATVRREGQTRELPVEQMVFGDVAIVRPNARLPADGFLITGTSAINQAPVTGESIPVDKVPVADAAAARAKPDAVDAESRVFAGTINGGGAIEIEVTRRSNESALAKVVKMVSEAETQKSPTQRFTDRFERIFVPAVLILSVLLLFAWVVVDEPFRDSFYRAMAVLVAASPCALAIATPSAVLSGVARAARGGVLVKGGAPLENLGSLKAIAFDKTGTLTEGRPRITDVVPVDGADEGELLALAVAVEALRDHPLDQALVKDGRERLNDTTVPHVSDLQALHGRGGVFVKGGAPLENLGSLKAIAFDKTGTLTEGRPRITDGVPVDGADEGELLALAVAVEALSDHPLAQAIVKDGRERLNDRAVPTAGDLKSLTGRGVTASVDGETVWIGKAEMFGSEGIPALGQGAQNAIAKLRENGRTTMVVRKGDRDLGAIGLMDTPREAAKTALRRLHEMGVSRMIMISGDHQKVAEAIANDVGIDEAWGDLMPEDKVAAIKKLAGDDQVAMRSEESSGGKEGVRTGKYRG